MEKNAIADLYQNYINSQEYEHRAHEIDADNDAAFLWLAEKLSFVEMQKFEEILVGYSGRNGQMMFESGFQYAWKLFHELSCVDVIKVK